MQEVNQFLFARYCYTDLWKDIFFSYFNPTGSCCPKVHWRWRWHVPQLYWAYFFPPIHIFRCNLNSIEGNNACLCYQNLELPNWSLAKLMHKDFFYFKWSVSVVFCLVLAWGSGACLLLLKCFEALQQFEYSWFELGLHWDLISASKWWPNPTVLNFWCHWLYHFY